MKSPPSDHHCQAKKDTITTNVISSFNGRRLVTSLILVITTIILLILLVVNLNCIIFTEATVNTTALAATQTASTSTSPSSPISTTTTTPTNTTTTISITTNITTPSQSHSSSNAFSSFNPLTYFKPLVNSTTNSENSGSNLVSNNNNNNNTIETPVVLAKIIKNSVSNITSGCGIMANTTATTTNTTTATNSSLMALNSNSSLANNVDTNEQQQQLQEVTKEDPCNVTTSEIKPQTDNQTSSTNETSKYFDIEFARKTFEDSMADKNAISLYHYLNGFKELMKFFHSLGTIFLFVTSDLEAKIGLLEGYRNAEKGSCNPAYLTIQSAIEYETKENLLRDPKRQSAARTILRLHRALEFLSALMLNLSKLDDVSETAPAAREAYSSTLANYHPWTIRTIASFAMRTLPRKKILVESVLGKEHSTNETLTNERMLMLANVTENLFNIVDKYYEENNIKDLP